MTQYLKALIFLQGVISQTTKKHLISSSKKRGLNINIFLALTIDDWPYKKKKKKLRVMENFFYRYPIIVFHKVLRKQRVS